ncbi:MAG: hypothetical protein MUO77_00425, partial [Anaerolineales bacterium]|nr:hypothetical protein [Anaerolineales bacterium]
MGIPKSIPALSKEKITSILIFCVLAISAWYRLTTYGDLRLSVGNADSMTYIASSRAPLFSWKIFAGVRGITSNLVYKLANDEDNCKLTAMSDPVNGIESARDIHPCFQRIALLQNFLAVISWCFLAWMTSRWLDNPFAKLLIAILIVTFGFTPQIAEWDSILGPESLTFSLFIISLALLEEIVFRIIRKQENINSPVIIRLVIAWFTLYAFWTHLREVHLHSIPITMILIGMALFSKKFAKSKVIIAAVCVLAGVFFLGYTASSYASRATVGPLNHAFDDFIRPYPARIEFFEKFGMPDQASPQFNDWFSRNAQKTYGLFLVSHPGFIAYTVLERSAYFRSDFIQPYYRDTIKKPLREKLIVIGEMLHPETNSVYLLIFLIQIGLIISAIKNKDENIISWAWISLWMLGAAAVTLF